MFGLGTIVNVIVIVIGGLAGTFIRKGMSERFKQIIMQAISLSVMMIGVSGVLQGMFKTNSDGALDRQYIMTMIFSMIIGGVLGEALKIEQKLDKLGAWAETKFSKTGGGFSEGFVTASLVFCVGAMAIVGSLEDGLTGNTSTLYAKSILDGVASVVFASTFGIGVVFAALPVLIYQGGITLLAVWIKPWLTADVITQMSLVGSVLILCIGINMLYAKKFKVGNLLPAIFMPWIFYLVISIFR